MLEIYLAAVVAIAVTTVAIAALDRMSRRSDSVETQPLPMPIGDLVAVAEAAHKPTCDCWECDIEYRRSARAVFQADQLQAQFELDYPQQTLSPNPGWGAPLVAQAGHPINTQRTYDMANNRWGDIPFHDVDGFLAELRREQTHAARSEALSVYTGPVASVKRGRYRVTAGQVSNRTARGA